VDEGHLTGIVTDRDICMAALMTGLPLGLIRVREVMTVDVFTCDPDDEISAAHALMREQQVRRLPVVDKEEQVVGIVSLNDLANEAFTGKSKAAAKRQRDMARTFAAIAIHHENGIAEGEEVEA
jgi:CBS-domain-containing membrane protein